MCEQRLGQARLIYKAFQTSYRIFLKACVGGYAISQYIVVIINLTIFAIHRAKYISVLFTLQCSSQKYVLTNNFEILHELYGIKGNFCKQFLSFSSDNFGVF